MRNLVLALMMSFLGQGVFGAGAAGGAGAAAAEAAGAFEGLILVEVTIEEIQADIEEMMNVPGFNKFFDIIITGVKEKTDDPDIQEGGSIPDQYNLIQGIKRSFDSLSLNDLMSQEFDLGLIFADILKINLSRPEKIPHLEIIEKFNITPREYVGALDPEDRNCSMVKMFCDLTWGETPEGSQEEEMECFACIVKTFSL